jgi:hypothetical protein
MDPKNELRFALDDVTYVINMANAAPALEMALSLAPMFAEMNLSIENKAEIKELPIGVLIAHLGSQEFRAMREYLISHVNVSRMGEKPYRFSDRYEAHMNAYPSHYIPVIGKSFGFQFGRFFRAGGAAAFMVPDKLRSLFETGQTAPAAA